MIDALLHHCDVEVLLGDGEMGTGRVAEHSHPKSLAIGTPYRFVKFAGLSLPEYPVTIVIKKLVSSLPTGVYSRVELITISSSPMIASEGRDIREGIIVQIEWWEVLIAKVFSEEVYQPSPAGVLLKRADVTLSELLHGLLSDRTVGILAHS